MKQIGVTSVFKSGTWADISRLALAASLFWIPLAMGMSAHAQATEQEPEQGANVLAPVIPQQVRYAGKLATRSGDTVEAVFSIYAAPEGGEALWAETQQVTVDGDGSYTVLLGSASPAGLPQSLFAAGAARWLGVSVERAPELARVLLSSVPYAMKSADAQALAGHPAGDFVTNEQLSEQLSQFAQSEAQRAQATELQPLTSGTVTGSGTAGIIPMWTGALTQGNSSMYQVGSKIGINEPSPAYMLDVNGAGQIRGSLVLPALATATTTTAQPSEVMQWSASAWSSTAAAAISPTFNLFIEPVNNNTASASGQFRLGYQLGTSHTTDLALTGTGALTSYGGFAAEPSSAATSSAAANSPLLELGASAYSSGSSSAVAQNFAWQVLPTGNDTATPSSNLALLYSTGTATPAATGLSISPKGLINWATGQTFPGTGSGTITGITTSSPLTGSGDSGSVALGLNTGLLLPAITPPLETTFNRLYAQLAANNTFTAPLENVFDTQVAAYGATGSNNAALYGFGTKGTVGTYGNSDTYYGLWGRSTTPAIGVGGVMGDSSTSFSGTYTSLGNTSANEVAGVWGDTTGNPNSVGGGSSGVYWAAGVLGTADGANAGAFYNTSDNGFYTVWAQALGTSGALGGSATSGNGVTGYSSSGNGVYGTTSSGDGVYGSSSTSAGVYGSSSSGDGVAGESYSGIGVSGTTTNNGTAGTGRHGVSGLATSPAPGNAGVFGNAYTTSDMYGFVTAFNIVSGVWADSANVNDGTTNATVGLVASVDNNEAAIIVNNSATQETLEVDNYNSSGPTGLFRTLRASTPDGTCGFGGAGDMTCTGQVKTLAITSGGARKVETYATQSAENWMEDYGTGTMKMGVAVVKIDPAFAETVSETADYHVFLTPNADSKGLYVINKTLTSFEVRESGGGTSSLTFDYKIVAKRRGYESQRLVDVTDRFNEEQARSLIARAHGAPIPAAGPRRTLIAHQANHPAGNGVGPNGVRAKTTPALVPVRHAHPAGSRVGVDGPTTVTHP